jgi:hypothetical protein
MAVNSYYSGYTGVMYVMAIPQRENCPFGCNGRGRWLGPKPMPTALVLNLNGLLNINETMPLFLKRVINQ